MDRDSFLHGQSHHPIPLKMTLPIYCSFTFVASVALTYTAKPRLITYRNIFNEESTDINGLHVADFRVYCKAESFNQTS